MKDAGLLFAIGILYAAVRGASFHDFLGHLYLILWLFIPILAMAFSLYIGDYLVHKKDYRSDRRGRE